MQVNPSVTAYCAPGQRRAMYIRLNWYTPYMVTDVFETTVLTNDDVVIVSNEHCHNMRRLGVSS